MPPSPSARKPLRLLAAPPLSPAGHAPKVSIHIPAYREPPEMLKQTLDALARLDYPNFECVVVINNTPDPAMWRPVEEHCALLGERFKFVRADNLQGFKAGALRLAMVHTAADAEVIGVLDADYVVQPEWLKDLVPLFADPSVGLIQAPQDHRDDTRSVLHHAMNAEYAGFFDIGMVQRNEVNAIIVHGTMCLVRRTALEAAGGWSSDTICEDTDLGLTILELGWHAHYTNRRYGHGLLPDTYEAYKKQRDRWAYGGFQILKKHWRRFLPGASRLSREQKREFTLGWLNWLGAETRRRRRRDPEHLVGAGRRLPRHRGAGPHPHRADRRELPGLGAARRDALPAARARRQTPIVRLDDRGDVGAVDRGARGRHRRDQGPPALRAHRQGRRQAQDRIPGVLGGGAGGAVDRRRGRRWSRPTTRKCARSTSSPPSWWCRACRSWPP